MFFVAYTYLAYSTFAIFVLLFLILLRRLLAVRKENPVQEEKSQDQQNVPHHDLPQNVVHPEALAQESSQQKESRTREKSPAQKKIKEQSVQNNEPKPAKTESMPPLKNVDQEKLNATGDQHDFNNTSADKKTSIGPNTLNAPVESDNDPIDNEKLIKQENENKEPDSATLNTQTAQQNVGVAEPVQQEDPVVSAKKAELDIEDESKSDNQSEQVQSTTAPSPSKDPIHDERSRGEEEARSLNEYRRSEETQRKLEVLKAEGEAMEAAVLKIYHKQIMKAEEDEKARNSEVKRAESSMRGEDTKTEKTKITIVETEASEKDTNIDEKVKDTNDNKLTEQDFIDQAHRFQSQLNKQKESSLKQYQQLSKKLDELSSTLSQYIKELGPSTEEEERLNAYKQSLLDKINVDVMRMSKENYEAYNQKKDELNALSSSDTTKDERRIREELHFLNLHEYQVKSKKLNAQTQKRHARVNNAKYTLGDDGEYTLQFQMNINEYVQEVYKSKV